jgi:hypothetical protein
MVEIEHKRSLADQMAGRGGRVVAMVVHGEERELELREGARGGVEAQVR